MCEYFLREETSEIVRANFSREYFRKSEYFSEHPIFCEYFWREHFKLFLIKQRVNESFSKVEKARKKKPMQKYRKLPTFISTDYKFAKFEQNQKTFFSTINFPSIVSHNKNFVNQKRTS